MHICGSVDQINEITELFTHTPIYGFPVCYFADGKYNCIIRMTVVINVGYFENDPIFEQLTVI